MRIGTKALMGGLVLALCAAMGCIEDNDGYSDGNGLDERSDTLESDMDGLTDEEERRLGTDPDNADSDGDGIDDGAEVEQGSDPLDSQDTGEDPDELACASDADCAPAQFCRQDTCVADTPPVQCQANDDCQRGQICQRGMCIDDRPDECQADADCGRGEICRDGACSQNNQCVDNDGDGFCPEDGDCNDDDPAINPRVPKDLLDGLDNDCDGQIDEDQPPPDQCRTDADCAPGQACQNGVCRG